MSLIQISTDILERDVFAPIRDDYADFDVPVEESFRWREILDHLRLPVGKLIALTAFRSIPNPEADLAELQRLDEIALCAAEGKDGFIFYKPHAGLSLCGWNTPEDTKNGVMSVAHNEAVAYARNAYLDHRLEQWAVRRLNFGTQVEFLPIEQFHSLQAEISPQSIVV